MLRPDKQFEKKQIICESIAIFQNVQVKISLLLQQSKIMEYRSSRNILWKSRQLSGSTAGTEVTPRLGTWINGWVLKRVTGSYHIYTKKAIRAILSVPVHGNRDLPIDTLKGLLKDAGLNEEDLD